jgi:protein-S-isoprenylcysteine O-methyltransferase Ste14
VFKVAKTGRLTMLMVLRQLLSVIALPVMVTGAIPIWIVRRNHLSFTSPADLANIASLLIGIAVLGTGLALFAACVSQFWLQGRGTLAPWDPPRRLVAHGPYRFVRNPMIGGVICILIGESCIFRSMALAQWSGLFTLINAIYIPALEEPMLLARFGETYRSYMLAVPRFLPRWRPWKSSR